MRRTQKVFKRIQIYFCMQKVRIKLNSIDIAMLSDICNSIREIAKKS